MVEVFKSTPIRRMTTGGNYVNLTADVVLLSDYEAIRAELEQVKRERDEFRDIAARKSNQVAGLIKTEAAERLAGARVRALEWNEAIHGGWVALGAAGVYHVHVGYQNDTRFYFFTNPFDHEPNEFCSEEKAKSAAQADYERRILSALAEPAGEAEPVATVALVRAAGASWHTVHPSNALDSLPVGTPLYTTPPDASAIRGALESDQWSIIDRAIERYSNGEISDLHALGLITSGFLKLDAERLAALAGAKP